MYEGVKITIGGADYIVPPLNLKRFRALKPKLAALEAVSADLTVEQMDVMVECVHAALSRNYPEITPDQIEEMIDLGNMTRIFRAVMSVSGLEQRLGEASPGMMEK